jgi:hypothetical protein
LHNAFVQTGAIGEAMKKSDRPNEPPSERPKFALFTPDVTAGEILETLGITPKETGSAKSPKRRMSRTPEVQKVTR